MIRTIRNSNDQNRKHRKIISETCSVFKANFRYWSGTLWIGAFLSTTWFLGLRLFLCSTCSTCYESVCYTIHKQRSQRPTLLVQQKQCLDVWSRHLIRWWTIDERFSRFVASKQPQQTILHLRIPSRFLHLDFYLHLYLHLYLHFYLHLYLDRRLSHCRTWRASIVPLFSSLPNGMSERYWTVPV